MYLFVKSAKNTLTVIATTLTVIRVFVQTAVLAMMLCVLCVGMVVSVVATRIIVIIFYAVSVALGQTVQTKWRQNE